LTLGLFAARFLRSSARGQGSEEGRRTYAEEAEPVQEVEVQYVGRGVAHVEPSDVSPDISPPAGAR